MKNSTTTFERVTLAVAATIFLVIVVACSGEKKINPNAGIKKISEASMKEWREASEEVKLATADDQVLSFMHFDGVDMGRFSRGDLKNIARQLVTQCCKELVLT